MFSLSSHSFRTGLRNLLSAVLIGLATTATAHAGVFGFAQGLWVANGTNVLEFGPPSTTRGIHDATPTVVLNSPIFTAPQGVVFDSKGDLWVIDGGTGTGMDSALDEFTARQLLRTHGSATLMPAVQITYGGFIFPQQAVFDQEGNLWTSDNGSGVVDIFSAKQLKIGGNLTPTFTVSSKIDNPFIGPLGIVLHGGSLYIANNGSTTILGFKDIKNKLTSPSVTLEPDVVLSDDGNGSIQAPWALVFDNFGNLWSSNANPPFTLVKFAPNQIRASGSPKPDVTISPVNVGKTTDTSLSAPNGIAFDFFGNIAAVSSAAPFGLATYSVFQQFFSAAAQPNDFIVGGNTTLNAPAGDNFGPLIR
jgi:hypothetical protein